MSRAKILVVEDEPDMLTLLVLLLTAEGYDVVTATDGEQALEQVAQTRPDLMLLDIMLPKVDGYYVCAQVKSDDRYRRMPVVMLTSRTLDRDEVLGHRCGADVYLRKPFDGETLLRKIDALVTAARAAKEDQP